MWGPLGTFSPDCLESPTPETYASGGSAGVQPRLIQGIRSGDGVGEGKDTIASIRY